MKFHPSIGRWLAAFALALLAGPVFAQGQAAAKPTEAAKAVNEMVMSALKEDAKCTGCHDESETRPLLSIYQTRHGVKADGRTPSCQSCHGASERHIKGDPAVKGRPRPDIGVLRSDDHGKTWRSIAKGLSTLGSIRRMTALEFGSQRAQWLAPGKWRMACPATTRCCCPGPPDSRVPLMTNRNSKQSSFVVRQHTALPCDTP